MKAGRRGTKSLLLGALAVAASLAGPGVARASDECRGLDVCISVPGPWVAIPAAPPGGARTVHYQLSCPRRTVVGGLDAVLGDPALDVSFLGKLGSPVNPGISTERRVVFVATWTRSRVTTFRPLAGCVPLNGGGRRSTVGYEPVAQAAAKPPLRRVRTLRLRGSTASLVAGCARGERLVGVSHAVAFRTKARPGSVTLGGVPVSRTRAGARVRLVARRAGVPRATRVEVQLHLLCARGPA